MLYIHNFIFKNFKKSIITNTNTNYLYLIKLLLKNLIGETLDIINFSNKLMFYLYLIILFFCLLSFVKLWLFYYKIKLYRVYNFWNIFKFRYTTLNIILNVHLLYNIHFKNTTVKNIGMFKLFKSSIKDIKRILLLIGISRLFKIILRTLIWLFLFSYTNNLMLKILIFIFIILWLDIIINYLCLFFLCLKHNQLKIYYNFFFTANLTFSNFIVKQLFIIFNCDNRSSITKIIIFINCYNKLFKLVTLWLN